MVQPNAKNPLLASSLSFIPGAGHFYMGKFKKAIALAFVDLGILLALFFFYTKFLILLTTIGVYLVTAGRAMHETYLLARYGDTSVTPDSKLYVMFMLVVTGFTALPLLWQDQRFSRVEKIVWSIAVPFLAILYFGGIYFIEFHKNKMGISH